MIAYVCSIGEKTTEICCKQLERFGFKVVLLDGKEKWVDKYKKFIKMANEKGEDCIRIDADVIPNAHIKALKEKSPYGMVQTQTYCLYANELRITNPVRYDPIALQVISENLNKLDDKRPETSAWRLKLMEGDTFTAPIIVGIHGFYQSKEDLIRHKQNKMLRKQDYDFKLAEWAYEN